MVDSDNYIERADGKGLLRDGSGKLILADQFDDEPSSRMYERFQKHPIDPDSVR